MDVRGEGTAERETVGAGLFLADAPRGGGVRRLERGASGDEGGPFDPSVHGDEATSGVELPDRGMAAQIKEPRAGAKLLPAHGVATAADRELCAGGDCGVDRSGNFGCSPGREDARDPGGIERRMEVVDEERIVHRKLAARHRGSPPARGMEGRPAGARISTSQGGGGHRIEDHLEARRTAGRG